MPAIAAISINDAATPTPVAHVFNPRTSVPPSYVRNGVAGQAVIAQERLGLNLKLAKSADGVNIAQMILEIPVSEVPAGGAPTGYVAPPAVAHILRAKVEFFLHNRSESVQRRDLRTLVMNALNNGQVADMIDKLEIPY